MFLVFDTETTGEPNWHRQAAQPHLQPFVVELACVLCSDDGTIHHEYSEIIDPRGWYDAMPLDAEKIHGISYVTAMEQGKPHDEVVADFLRLWAEAEMLVAFSVGFDLKMMRTELHRSGQPGEAERLRDFPRDDPMVIARAAGKKAGHYWYSPKGNKKAPTLSEAMEWCFPEETWTDAHRALPDALAARRVYLACREKLAARDQQDVGGDDALI